MLKNSQKMRSDIIGLSRHDFIRETLRNHRLATKVLANGSLRYESHIDDNVVEHDLNEDAVDEAVVAVADPFLNQKFISDEE